MSFLEALVNFAVAKNVPRTRGSVTGFGTVTYPISQAMSPICDLIGTVPASAGGICELLAAKWLECEVKGTSLETWLGAQKNVDPSKIRMLMQYFIIGTEMTPRHMTGEVYRAPGEKPPATYDSAQTKATKNYLEQRGLRMMNGNKLGSFEVVELNLTRGGKTKRRVHATILATAIAGIQNPYCMIGIRGPGGAHACAARVDGASIKFFDPNYGEFSFATHAKFIDWMPSFWHKSLYGNQFKGLSDTAEIIQYKPGPRP